MKKHLQILIFILFTTILSSYSQVDSSKIKYGIYGGLNINLHNAEFSNLPGIPNCCPRFESGNGLGFNAGLLYEYLVMERLRIGGRIGIQTFDGVLSKNEDVTVLTESGPTNGIFEHKVESNFLNIGFEPTIIYNPFSNFHVNLGMRFGQNLTYTFSQAETIISPEGVGTFLDDDGNDSRSRVRNQFSGDLPDAITFQFGIVTGVGYELPLNKDNSMRILPEISLYHSLTDFVENTNWNLSSIRMGLAIKYSPLEKPAKEKIYKDEFKIDTIFKPTDLIAGKTYSAGKELIRTFSTETDNQIIVTEVIQRTDTIFVAKQYGLEGSISAVGVDSVGQEISSPVFRIEEYVSNRLDPLLNYVFFDDNSSEISKKFKLLNSSETGKFSTIDLLRESTLDIYYNSLNIIALRLKEFPKSRLTLIGCNSDFGAEAGNIELSKKRAEAVRDYFINNWGISADRIKIESRNLPQKASTPKNEPDKIAENRRVEIYSDDYRILEPLFIEKIDRTANPPIVRFKPTANSEAGLKKWEITAYQSSDMQNKFSHIDSSSNISDLDWVLEDFQKIIPKFPEAVKYSLTLEDTKGNNKNIESQTLPIDVISIQNKRREMQGDHEIERYSLILFDFDKSSIEENHKKIIDFISKRIKPDSEIEITGYTDRTGNPDYNQRLSEQRANAVKSALYRRDAVAKGVGQSQLLYSNDTPEGRFYCRTVNIVVKTKVK